EEFGDLSSAASDALAALISQQRASLGIQEPAKIMALEGAKSLREYRDAALEAGVPVENLSELQERYATLLQAELADSPAARYIAGLPDATRDALLEQERLAEVQRLVTEEQEKNWGGAEKFAVAYS